MSLIERLCELQEIDQEWNEKGRLYQAVRQRLADDSALNALRQAQAARQEELAALRTGLRNDELELDTLNERLGQAVNELYSGHIRAPKELESLRQDGEHLRARIAQLEDQALGAMGRIEEMQAAAQAAADELAALEAQRAAERGPLQGRYSELHARLQILQDRRAALRATIQGGALAHYDELRAKKAGQALAPMKEGVCQICRVSVPVVKIAVAQEGEGVVTCEGCGRILYPAR